jgi:hypothetical protein
MSLLPPTQSTEGQWQTEDTSVSPTRKTGGKRKSAEVQDVRDQEVLRANRELAAFFRGGRTEGEARAALKTIKAFVRDRERQDPAERAPLPGAEARSTPQKNAIESGAIRAKRRKEPRKQKHVVETTTTALEAQDEMNPSSSES